VESRNDSISQFEQIALPRQRRRNLLMPTRPQEGQARGLNGVFMLYCYLFGYEEAGIQDVFIPFCSPLVDKKLVAS
jgi:hypothetical protein